jgi:hypothetical protein
MIKNSRDTEWVVVEYMLCIVGNNVKKVNGRFSKNEMPTSTGTTHFEKHVGFLPFVRDPINTLKKPSRFLHVG